MLELRYNTTAGDYIALLGRYAAGSVVAERFTRMTFLVIPALAWVSTILFYIKQHTANYNYIFCGIFALLLTITLPKLYDTYQNAFWGSVITEDALRGLAGPTILTVTDEYIEETTSKTIHRAPWKEVERIEQTKEHILIFLAPLLAIAVPLRIFAEEEDRLRFSERLQAVYKARRTP